MTETKWDLLLNPDRFFAKIAQTPPSFKVPVIIVGVAAAFAGVYAFMTSSVTARIFSGQAAQMGGIIGAFGGISGFIAQFIMWLVVSVVFFVLAMAFSGKGPFLKTLEVTGYGMVPMIIANGIETVLAMVYLPSVRVNPVTSMDPTVMTSAVTRLMQDPSMRALSLSSTLVMVIFLIWSANLWIFGMKHARGLTLKHAFLCVAIPVGIYIAATAVFYLMGQNGV
jgi:hypothetical protein